MCAKRREARNFEKVPLGGVGGHYSHFSTQAKDMLHHASNAKEPEIFLKGMACP
jgi:hypothetical protein